MASCEMCGKECVKTIPATIDGATMMMCSECVRHGKPVTIVKPRPAAPSGSQRHFVSGRVPKKDVFQTMEKELVDNWADKIKNARVQKGLSREELGFNIGERTVTISKIENGDLRPSDKVAKKIEKELNISLFEQVEKIKTEGVKQPFSRGGFTLGDFIRSEE